MTPSRITENLKGTDVKLDAEDIRRLRELGSTNLRYLKVGGVISIIHTHYVFFLWFQGNIFWRPGQTEESFWDAEQDAMFVVK